MLVRSILVFMSLVVVSATTSAGVRGISTQKKSVDSNGVPSTIAVVRCSTSKESKTIVRKGDERQWCDSLVTSVCDTEKIKAAKKVCSSSYNRLLDEQLAGEPNAMPMNATALKTAAQSKSNKVVNAKPVAKVNKAAKTKKNNRVDLAAAQTELLDIEQQRVQIRQRQLELRKLELQLQKQRASDIESGS